MQVKLNALPNQISTHDKKEITVGWDLELARSYLSHIRTVFLAVYSFILRAYSPLRNKDILRTFGFCVCTFWSPWPREFNQAIGLMSDPNTRWVPSWIWNGILFIMMDQGLDPQLLWLGSNPFDAFLRACLKIPGYFVF